MPAAILLVIYPGGTHSNASSGSRLSILSLQIEPGLEAMCVCRRAQGAEGVRPRKGSFRTLRPVPRAATAGAAAAAAAARAGAADMAPPAPRLK